MGAFCPTPKYLAKFSTNVLKIDLLIEIHMLKDQP